MKNLIKLLIFPLLVFTIFGINNKQIFNLHTSANTSENISIICPTENCDGVFEKGKCNKCEHQFAASIGEIGYDDFETAMDNAVAGDTIYCYVNFSEDFKIPQGITLAGGDCEFSGYVTNNGTIESGKFTKESSGATEEEEDFGGFNDLINGGNSNYGVINNGTINNGKFLGKIENNGIIYNGTFNNDLTNNTHAKFYGGLIYGDIKNYGEFLGGETINNFENYGTITDGKFYSIKNMESGIINGGEFIYHIENNGVINNLNTGDLVFGFSFSVINKGTINCQAHINLTSSGEHKCNCRVCGEIVHKPITDKRVEPTCSKKGLTEGSHCEACNEVFVAQEEIKALGADAEKEHHIDLDNNNKCDDCKAWLGLPIILIVIIAIIAVIAIGVAGFSVYWFVIRKKKKQKVS